MARKMKKIVNLNTPEGFTEVDNTLKYENVSRRQIVVCKVLCWDEARNGIIVYFGNQIKGFIKKEEISIYNMDKIDSENNIPCRVNFILGKKIIAQILSYNTETEEFYLSRANLMREATENVAVGTTVMARITHIAHTNIFVDLGCGIEGKVYISDLSYVYTSSCKILNLKVGDEISLKVLNRTENNQFNLSKKEVYPTYEEQKYDYLIGQKLRVRVHSLSPHLQGDTFKYSYCVEVVDKPNLIGMLNTNQFHKDGSVLQCVLIKLKQQGLKLIEVL